MKIYRYPSTATDDRSHRLIHEERLSARKNHVVSPWVDNISMGGEQRKSALCIEFESKDVFALHERVMRALLADSKRLSKVLREQRKLTKSLQKIRDVAASAKSHGRPRSFETIRKLADTALKGRL